MISIVAYNHNHADKTKVLKTDYETRFLESLKRLNAPVWLNSTNTESETQKSKLNQYQYGTKHKYDKLKQRFRSNNSGTAKRTEENVCEVNRIRHKSIKTWCYFDFNLTGGRLKRSSKKYFNADF